MKGVMALNEYQTERMNTWNCVATGLAIWIFALASLFLAETAVYDTAKVERTDDFSVQRNKSIVLGILTDKEFDLLNCRYCE